jgi:hypothetical protein
MWLVNPYRFAVVAAYDTDAQAYITAVETADTQALETGVKDAINAFVVGCKADGIWTAIKASCILAGARTLAGALVPLVGTAPTNVGPFVSGDYDRKTGLIGNGSTKYLSSNRANNADPQNSNHNAVYATSVNATSGTFIAADGTIAGTNFIGGGQTAPIFTRSRASAGTAFASNPVAGLIGTFRAASGSYTIRCNGSNATGSNASTTTESSTVLIFRRGNAASPTYGSHRIAFYSIGEALTLSLLEARLITLINTFAAVIP